MSLLSPADTPDHHVHHTLSVDPGQAPLRLDKFLFHKLADISRNRIQVALHAGTIRLNGGTAKPNHKVRPHDLIEVVLPYPPRDRTLLPEDLPLEVIYEDEALVVINKQATMVMHPGHGNWEGTLVHALLHHFGTLPAAPGNEARPGLVHRIDKGTSGLLVIAKQPVALTKLAKQFADRTILRRYTALIWGTPSPEAGTIRKPLARSPHDRRCMAPCAESMGKHATTHYAVTERLGYVAQVSCTLETGRTHQIRAHMQSLGHPLFGDPRYGGDRVVLGPVFTKYKAFVANCFRLLPYQALHAQTLGFCHPTTGEHMHFDVPPPTPFLAVLARWRRYATQPTA